MNHSNIKSKKNVSPARSLLEWAGFRSVQSQELAFALVSIWDKAMRFGCYMDKAVVRNETVIFMSPAKCLNVLHATPWHCCRRLKSLSRSQHGFWWMDHQHGHLGMKLPAPPVISCCSQDNYRNCSLGICNAPQRKAWGLAGRMDLIQLQSSCMSLTSRGLLRVLIALLNLSQRGKKVRW